ncbi:condensation domain-containing protein [Streptomyces sp. AC627_RSS907]|uniref:condensation domain-containing protein n=1 Tax=Streptomyces sp. AC627_RSS907 TaxID=2823684 RepID=UPI001C23DA91|nr:condensation domain-containing protein [Streptomyces sp. AC627_RSS907]
MARQSRPRAVRGRPGTSRRPGVPVVWPQYDLLRDVGVRRHTGRNVEQLTWRWCGPLDTERFTAAWQSVVDRETVLRAAFAGEPKPRVVFHDHARAEVVRHRAGTVDWDRLLERDRRRGFDLRRPCPLRVTLVDLADAGSGRVTRVLLTFHHALLDAWSVFVLLEEVCRAYLAGGALPGGERRPDLRDWVGWLERQDPAPARDFWLGAVPGDTVAVLPARHGPRTRQRGLGRAEVRLSPADAGRLHRWAALRSVPDSSALQTVWALLLYRAARHGGAATVGFGVTVSGRGIALDGAERLPGPMRNCLPMVVRVDPEETVGRLLTALRDRALDMAAYEWVSTGQIHRWTGRSAVRSTGRSAGRTISRSNDRATGGSAGGATGGSAGGATGGSAGGAAGGAAGGELLESLVSVESAPRPLTSMRAELAAAGVVLEPERASGAWPDLPVALLVHRGGDGSLTFAVVHDRDRISDGDAHLLAGHCARLLRHLPSTGETTTAAAVLDVLAGEALPRIAPRTPAPGGKASRLRPHSTGGGAAVDRATSEP